jgi:hypothetical protein
VVSEFVRGPCSLEFAPVEGIEILQRTGIGTSMPLQLLIIFTGCTQNEVSRGFILRDVWALSMATTMSVTRAF